MLRIDIKLLFNQGYYLIHITRKICNYSYTRQIGDAIKQGIRDLPFPNYLFSKFLWVFFSARDRMWDNTVRTENRRKESLGFF